jgi:hypothetical protein
MIFSIFFPESMIKHIKTETNRYAKSIADKLRRSKKAEASQHLSGTHGPQ